MAEENNNQTPAYAEKLKQEQKIVDAKGIELGKKSLNLKPEDFLIHKMPERFLKSGSNPDKAKSTGMLILVLGAVVMIGALLFAYSYFTGTDKGLTISKEEDSITAKVKIPVPNSQNNPPVSKPEAEENDFSSPEEESASSSLGTFGEEDGEDEWEEEEIDGTASSSAPLIVEAASSTPASSSPSASAPSTYNLAPDADGDQLSDLEELVFDSDLNHPDSDQDGYSDFSEILNLYNPTGQGGIISNPNIDKYENDTYSYALYYPKNWTISQIGNSESMIFRASNNHFFQVIASELGGRSFDDWVESQLDIPAASALTPFFKNGWVAYYSPDGLTVYMNRPGIDKVFIAAYNPVQDNTLYYQAIFQVFVKSLEITVD